MLHEMDAGEEHSVAENEAPKDVEVVKEEAQVAPLTREQLAAKLEQLSARARAAGMSPLQAMLSDYARRGMSLIDSMLSGLEENTKKPPAEDAPTKKKA